MADEGSILQARRLLRAARAATLATAAAGGQPFASLVTPATAPDLSPLLFLSTLSEHTRHLQADRRCALMVVGAPDSANPQTAPRVTVTAVAEPEPDPALKARWLAVHPYAELYAGFADFALWRLRLGGALLVGGFARATRLRTAELAPAPEAVAAIAAAEPSIVEHCNRDHADAMGLLAGSGGRLAHGGCGRGRVRSRTCRSRDRPGSAVCLAGADRLGGRGTRGAARVAPGHPRQLSAPTASGFTLARRPP